MFHLKILVIFEHPISFIMNNTFEQIIIIIIINLFQIYFNKHMFS